MYFAGPNYIEKGHEIYFLAAIDRFSTFSTACIFDKANGSNELKSLDMYIGNNPTHRSIRLDQAKFFVGQQVKTFCNKKNINLIEAPVYNH